MHFCRNAIEVTSNETIPRWCVADSQVCDGVKSCVYNTDEFFCDKPSTPGNSANDVCCLHKLFSTIKLNAYKLKSSPC